MSTITVYKVRRELVFVDGAGHRHLFPIALGREPMGHKRREGDGRTPEGVYRVCTRNAESKYHRSLGISYPSESDARAALGEGRIDEALYAAIAETDARGLRPLWDTPLGGFIMIHGGGLDGDWTQGCIALIDQHMDILWEHTRIGDLVTIHP